MCQKTTIYSKAIEVILTAGTGNYILSNDNQLTASRIDAIQLVNGDITPKSPISGATSASAADASKAFLRLRSGGNSNVQIHENYPCANLLNFSPAAANQFPVPTLELNPVPDINGTIMVNKDGSPVEGTIIDFTQSFVSFPDASGLTTGQALTFIVYFH